jgi:thiamine-monophosphate kinase
VWLAGPVGLAGAGLELLQRGMARRLPLGMAELLPASERSAGLRPPEPIAEPFDHAVDAALAAFALPLARIEAGRRASRGASSAIDLSDGLACDATRVAVASSAVGGPIALVLDADVLVADELRALAPSVLRGEPLPKSKPPSAGGRPGAQLGRPALDFALHGGEDYALLVTAPEGFEPEGFVRVGRCVPRSREAPALRLRWPDGRDEPVPPTGYDHFSA